MTPQVSHAGKLFLMKPGDATVETNFITMRDAWFDKADELTGLVDAATDAVDFVKESEAAIMKDKEAALEGMANQNQAVMHMF